MMKLKRILLLLIPLAFGVLFIGGTMNSGGSPGGKTGSVGDGGESCTQCHGGTISYQTNWISSDIPIDGYIPGDTYTITLNATHSGVVKFGFECTAEELNGTKSGIFTITNSGETKLINSDAAVTQTSGGNTPSGDTKSWSFDWQAPVQGTGTVKFYTAFNAANGNGSTSGDIIYGDSVSIIENISSNVSLIIDSENYILRTTIIKNKLIINNQIDFIHRNFAIYDVNGRLILEGKISNESQKINVNKLSSGIYIFSVGNYSQKFVKK